MRKQYLISKVSSFLNKIELYHDGNLIHSHECWDDELFNYTEDIERDGYELAARADEVAKAKRHYEQLLARQLYSKEGIS